MIEKLFMYLFITTGCSYLWSTSEIFMPIRNFVAKNFPIFLRKMLLCMECSSFWIGVFISLFVLPSPYPHNMWNSFLIQAVCGGISTYLIIKLLINFNLTGK
jgi:uncharacterized membrane protein